MAPFEDNHRVRNAGFDGFVREHVREGYREDLEMLSVEELVECRYGSLDGDGTTVMKERRTRVSVPKKHAYDVMVALADYFGHEVRPK